MNDDRKNTAESGHNDDETAVVRVECYAGHRAEESPRRFFIGKRAIEVIEIIDRWLGPNHRYFKVRGDDGGSYLLRNDQDTGSWEMTLFDSGTRDQTRPSPI
jgi:hypothetical protein